MTFTVQYSTDDGISYKTISLNQESMDLTAPRTRLAGSTQARVRVIASDGTRSTTAESPRFTVANNLPWVRIRHPNDLRVFGGYNRIGFGGYNRIALDAVAFDTEDGKLEGSTITWSSSIDGQLATTGYAWISTDDLSTGRHTLTATATDSSGQTASAEITIVVNDANDAPVAEDDVEHAVVGRAAMINVVTNDTDTEADINPYSLTIVTPPSLGVATVGAHDIADPAVIRYAAATAGVDVLVYRICDRMHQCSTWNAEVAIVSLGR